MTDRRPRQLRGAKSLVKLTSPCATSTFQSKETENRAFTHSSSKVKSATYLYFCFNVNFLSSSRTVLVFGQKIVTRFLRIKVFMQEGSRKKSVFSIERHYNVGSKMMQN